MKRPLCLSGLALLLAACAAAPAPRAAERAAATTPPPSSQPAAAPNTVIIDNFTFSPPTLTVPLGTTVTWINHDDVPHTVTSAHEPHTLNSPVLDTDGKYTATLTAPGTYDYYCTVHPHMTGRVVVQQNP